MVVGVGDSSDDSARGGAGENQWSTRSSELGVIGAERHWGELEKQEQCCRALRWRRRRRAFLLALALLVAIKRGRERCVRRDKAGRAFYRWA